MNSHKEALIVAIIAVLVLGVYHFYYVPQAISQARQEQKATDDITIAQLNSKISSLQSENEDLKADKETATSQLENAKQQIINVPTYSYYDDADIDDLNDKIYEQENEMQDIKDKYNEAEEKRYQKELNEWLDDKRDLPPESPDYEY